MKKSCSQKFSDTMSSSIQHFADTTLQPKFEDSMTIHWLVMAYFVTGLNEARWPWSLAFAKAFGICYFYKLWISYVYSFVSYGAFFVWALCGLVTLILTSVSYLHVIWVTFTSVSGFLELFVLELEACMGRTDRRTDRRDVIWIFFIINFRLKCDLQRWTPRVFCYTSNT